MSGLTFVASPQLCCECQLRPSILRGMCRTCNARTDTDERDERARAFYADNPHLLADDHDPSDDDERGEW